MRAPENAHLTPDMLPVMLAATLTLLVGSYLFVEGFRASRTGQHRAALVLAACLMLAMFGAAHLQDRHWASAFVFIAGAAGFGLLQSKKAS